MSSMLSPHHSSMGSPGVLDSNSPSNVPRRSQSANSSFMQQHDQQQQQFMRFGDSSLQSPQLNSPGFQPNASSNNNNNGNHYVTSSSNVNNNLLLNSTNSSSSNNSNNVSNSSNSSSTGGTTPLPHFSVSMGRNMLGTAVKNMPSDGSLPPISRVESVLQQQQKQQQMHMQHQQPNQQQQSQQQRNNSSQFADDDNLDTLIVETVLQVSISIYYVKFVLIDILNYYANIVLYCSSLS